MADALARVTELQDALSHFDGRELRRQIEKLQAVHAWALKQQPVQVGDRAELRRTPKADNGWRAYSEVLVAGCIGRVLEVDYWTGSWVALFQPEKQWSTSTTTSWQQKTTKRYWKGMGPRPEGYESSWGSDPSCFYFNMKDLKRID